MVWKSAELEQLPVLLRLLHAWPSAHLTCPQSREEISRWGWWKKLWPSFELQAMVGAYVSPFKQLLLCFLVMQAKGLLGVSQACRSPTRTVPKVRLRRQ